MERKLILTDDGSHSLYIPDLDESYHSTHGAIQESKHVFIEAGLKHIKKKVFTIFEVGLGTGLNALLTIKEAIKSKSIIKYVGIEKYPLTANEYSKLNYSKETKFVSQKTFLSIHESDYNIETKLNSNFTLTKINADITKFNFDKIPMIDLVYYDAFAPNKQSKVWEMSIFQMIYNNCNQDAILVTYCAKGSVRRILKDVGFKVERIPGPPGKREMLRAIK